MLWNDIKKSNDILAIREFCKDLTQSHDRESLEYHYSLLKEEEVEDRLFQSLRRSFQGHGEAGEVFLQEKFLLEKDVGLKSQGLQILGGFRKGIHLNKTRELALEALNSREVILRNRAIIVLGWVGTPEDLERIFLILSREEDTETRGWAASAFMQLQFRYPHDMDCKRRILHYLKSVLNSEKEDFVLHCILVSIQELLNHGLGLSSTSHHISSKAKIAKAKEKALSLLGEDS